MRQDKKQTNRPAVALALCFCLMALVSVFAVKASIDKVNDNMQSAQTSEVSKKQAVDDISDAARDAETDPEVVDSRDNQSADSGSDGFSGNDSAEKAAEYIFPVQGEIIMKYSMDMPIYWNTLDQYMTHSGIDIAAAEGTPVIACADGTVTKIEENDKMGVTVEVNHGNGMISVYSNLAADGLIELGEIIAQGTVIGKVGRSARFEFEDPDHLHFEMRLNDEPTDPGYYLR